MRIRCLFVRVIFPVVAAALASVSCTDNDELDNGISSRIQSIVFVSDTTGGSIALTDGQPATIVYSVQPAELAQTIASQYARSLSFVGKLVQTRSVGDATLSVTGVTGTADGLLTITATHSGFIGGQDYAFALELNDGTTQFRTAYTPTFLTVLPESIAIIAFGLSGDGTLTAGNAVQLEVVFTPTYVTDQRVTWSSSDPTVATVSEDGLLVAIRDGSVTVTAQTAGGKTASLTISIASGDIHISRDDLSQTMAE